MVTLLLIVIYLAFISLGLPDSLLGSAWPAMHMELGVSSSSAGIVTMVIAGCTIISSLVSDRLIHKFGTSIVTLVSVGITAFALMGFGFSSEYWMLIILAIPLGLGAGSVDAALNNYVAIHFNAKHMNWLHCCWGLGATLGPIIVSSYLAQPGGWHTGYKVISVIQLGLTIILLLSLPIWKKVHPNVDIKTENTKEISSTKNVFRMSGVKLTLFVLFFYCAAEMTAGLWGSTYLVTVRGFAVDMGARAISFYYGGITAGRMIAGFLSVKISNKSLVRLGQGVSLLGSILVLLPLGNILPVVGLLLVGLGFAPIYPAMIHETPKRFGVSNSQKIIGYQMASAYIGITFMPMLLGQVSRFTGIIIFPPVLIGFILCMVVTSEGVLRIINSSM